MKKLDLDEVVVLLVLYLVKVGKVEEVCDVEIE